MGTNRLLFGVVALALSMGVLWGSWALARATADGRGTVTTPVPLLGVAWLLAFGLWLAAAVLLIGAMAAKAPPVVR